MAMIMDDFREYLDFYLKDYLDSEHIDWKRPDWVQVVDRLKNLAEQEARIRYLQTFLWAMNEELLQQYRADPQLRIILRQAVKICSIIDGEFLRFNDAETKRFVVELAQLAGIDFTTVRMEPAEPFFEDLIHFVSNFIDWHKQKRGIPLRLW
jgi:hypothetical protein